MVHDWYLSVDILQIFTDHELLGKKIKQVANILQIYIFAFMLKFIKISGCMSTNLKNLLAFLLFKTLNTGYQPKLFTSKTVFVNYCISQPVLLSPY